MEERENLNVPGQAGEIAALTARVAELERTVAALSQQGEKQAFQPIRRAASAPPPPPAPGASSLPMIAAADTVQGIPAVSPLRTAMPAAEGKSLESRLGAQVFNLVGILALVIAAAYGLKLAIEHGYLGPVARVLIGIVAGVAVVLWSESFRRKGMAAFSYPLKAVGSAVLYLTLWAAFQLYHLLPAPVALGLMVLVTAWNAFMAWSQDSELLAAYALAGGFLTPLLLSTGGNHEGFLLTYVGAIDLAVVALLRTKPWRRLLVPTFVISAAYFAGWYSAFYRIESVGRPFAETLAFLLVFFAIFAVVSVRGWVQTDPARDTLVAPVLVPLLNAAFTGVALYGLLVDSDLVAWRPWLMVAMAAVYLGLMRVQHTSMARAIHLALAVIFLTGAIPLKASGHTLTTAWLVEGLVLLWVSTRFEAESEERQAAGLLAVLSAGGYVLGLGSLLAHWFVGSVFGMDGFFNRDLGAAAVAVATLAGALWLTVRDREKGRGTEALAVASLLAIDGVAVLLCFRELASTWSEEGRHGAFANASFATALVGLMVLAAVAYVAMSLRRLDGVRLKGMQNLAGATVIGFNLLTILSVEREIGALWHRGNADLQRSLAISGFLMAYGAGLLALGFVKRSAFVRWQALVLLLFTICKVFLYDISGLSAGYRVASFMGLGAVLMGISYAYQKDWLGLKEVPPAGPSVMAQTAGQDGAS